LGGGPGGARGSDRRLSAPTPDRGQAVRGRSADLFVERVGSGPPIVLLHGLADDHRLWRRIVPRLSDRYETIAVDLPGHGRSGPIPEGAPIEWFAQEILGLVDRLALGPIVLAGLSMGGGIAQYVAIATPQALRGLVLVSTSPVHPESTRRRFLDRAALAERDGMAGVVDATVPRWFTPAWLAGHPDEVELTRRTVLATDPAQFARASRANADRDCTAGLEAIDCPVLFVGGLDDPADPARAAAIYERELGDVTIELLPGLSHLLPVEAPERFGPILEAFLARVSAPSAAAASASP
jgi:3-oxoadipate enol-lactonase